MAKRTAFKNFKEEVLKNEKVKAEYDALRPEFELMMEFIRARKAAKLSQASLAKKLKLQQPTIARLENGGYLKTSLANLTKVANTMGYSLKVTLHPKKTS